MTRRSIEELGDLLELPYCAVMSTHWPDGTVLLSPVWHEWRDGGFNVCVAQGDIKLRHISSDPRVTIVVYDNERPYRGFEVRGIARATPAGRADVARRLAVRYLGPTRGNAYADLLGPGAVVRVEAQAWRAWDYAEEPGSSPASP